MATKDEDRGTIRIPAAYLEDVRCALVDEIDSDSGALAVNQAALVESKADRVEMHLADRDASVETLARDLRLLAQLRDATGDTKVTGDVDTLTHTLEAMVRILGRRLTDVCQYGPIPLGDVLELTARLRWAANEAIRLEPGLAHRLSDEKAVA
jgi:hypothetical protein